MAKEVEQEAQEGWDALENMPQGADANLAGVAVEGPAPPANGEQYTRDEKSEVLQAQEGKEVEKPQPSEEARLQGSDEQKIPRDPGKVTISRGERTTLTKLPKGSKRVTIVLVPREFPILSFSGGLWRGEDVIQAIAALRRGYRLYQSQAGKKKE